MSSRLTTVLFASASSLLLASPAFGVLALPSMQPGPARPWQSQIKVSTYSSVNTFHGNMFTALPLVSWSGRGPDMNMALYHNSANWNQTYVDTKNVGFFLGPGWSVSYSDYIIPNPMTVVHADGTRDIYTWNGTSWVPPAGVFDQLSQPDPVNDPETWRVTHKDQSFHEFRGGWLDTDLKRLIRIHDGIGDPANDANSVLLHYLSLDPPNQDRSRLWKVCAAGRCAEFECESIAPTEPMTRLIRIKDPGETNENVTILDRSWTIAYGADGSTWLTSVTDPIGNRNDFAYISACSVAPEQGQPCPPQYTTYSGRFASVSDKYRLGDPTYGNPNKYTHTYITLPYGQHKAQVTCDPGCSSCGVQSTCSKQKFTYIAQIPGT